MNLDSTPPTSGRRDDQLNPRRGRRHDESRWHDESRPRRTVASTNLLGRNQATSTHKGCHFPRYKLAELIWYSVGQLLPRETTGLNGCSTQSPLAPGTRNSYTLTPSLTHVRMVVRSGWSINNTFLKNGNSRESPPGEESSPTLTGTSHGAIHAAPSHSERMESHETASSADRGRKVAAAHSASGDGSTRLTWKDSLTFSHCARRRLRHPVRSTYAQ